MFNEDNAFQNVDFKIDVILLQPQYVNTASDICWTWDGGY